jgi:hypothetical protein
MCMHQILRLTPRLRSSAVVCAVDTGCSKSQPLQRMRSLIGRSWVLANTRNQAAKTAVQMRFVVRGKAMKLRCMGSIAAAIACVGVVMPTPVFAAPRAAASVNCDIALGSGGLLVGEVIDQQGVPKAGMPVSVQFAGQEIVRTTTDANGVFAAKGLRDGQYCLVTPQGDCHCRLWEAGAAPTLSRPAALVVLGTETVRGQHGQGGMVGWMRSHPYITAGTVIAAIAIPLALANDGYDRGN